MAELKSETFRVIAVDYLSMYDRSIAPTDTEYTAHAEQYEHYRDGIVWRARILLPGRTETGEACSAHEAVQRAATVLSVRELLRAGEPTRAELAERAAGAYSTGRADGVATMRRAAVGACQSFRVARGVASPPSQAEAWAIDETAARIADAIEELTLDNAATTAPAQEQTPIVGAGNVRATPSE